MPFLRSIALCAVIVSAPGCLFWSDDHPTDPGDDYDPSPGPPPDAAPPWEWPPCTSCDGTQVDFGAGPLHLAVGTTLVRYFSAHGAYTIASDNPDVATVTAVTTSEDRMVIETRSAGTANLIARRQSDNLEIARLPVIAVEVAGAQIWPRTSVVPGQPVTSLAGVVDGFDTIGVTLVDADGARLLGRGAVRIDGTAAALDPTVEVWRASELLESRDRYGMRFDTVGTASLVVGVADGREWATPLRVVAAPASIEIVVMVTNADFDLLPAPPVIDSHYLAGIDVVGRTTNGTLVAGVTATWTATAGVHALGDLAVPDTELVFNLDPGTSEITTTSGAFTVTTALVAQ